MAVSEVSTRQECPSYGVAEPPGWVRAARFWENLGAERWIGVDDSASVRQILLSHGITVNVGEIAATPHRYGFGNGWDR